MQLTIRHATEYHYSQPVDYALQKVRLRPISSDLQTVDAWSLDVDGGVIEASYTDHYGNPVALVSATPGSTQLTLTAHGTVSTVEGKAGMLGPSYGRAPLWHFQQSTPQTAAGEMVLALSHKVIEAANTLDGLHALSAAVLDQTPYTLGKTTADTTAEQAMALGFGVCQDHANIFISAARAAGLPARYVSGYLMMSDRIDQDASHAWAEVHVDNLGWVGFDVSNGYAPDERYVRLALGRDSRDAAPVSGLRMGPAQETMQVTLQVQQ